MRLILEGEVAPSETLSLFLTFSILENAWISGILTTPTLRPWKRTCTVRFSPTSSLPTETLESSGRSSSVPSSTRKRIRSLILLLVALLFNSTSTSMAKTLPTTMLLLDGLRMLRLTTVLFALGRLSGCLRVKLTAAGVCRPLKSPL